MIIKFLNILWKIIRHLILIYPAEAKGRDDVVEVGKEGGDVQVVVLLAVGHLL